MNLPRDIRILIADDEAGVDDVIEANGVPLLAHEQ